MNRRLRNRREKIGLTQVQVAEKAGITERSYQRYEANERIPDVYTAQLIARTMETTVEEIFPLRGGNPIEEKPDGNRAK